MPFDAYDRSLDLLRSLAPLLARVAGCDASLADQLRRAATSCVLNVAEGNKRLARDRKARFRTALGSAAEVTACLQVAEVLAYVEPEQCQAALLLSSRVQAMLFRLSK
jgi:four helix bundle protein